MSNNTRYQFDLNYAYNPDFKELCDTTGIMFTGFYGEPTASASDIQHAMSEYGYRKKSVLWFKNLDDVDLWLDMDCNTTTYLAHRRA